MLVLDWPIWKLWTVGIGLFQPPECLEVADCWYWTGQFGSSELLVLDCSSPRNVWKLWIVGIGLANLEVVDCWYWTVQFGSCGLLVLDCSSRRNICKLWIVGIGLFQSPKYLEVADCWYWTVQSPDLNYVGLRPSASCGSMPWAPEGAQGIDPQYVGLRPPFAPAARFPVGPYLAPAQNLPLGELIDTSFGAVRVPIRSIREILPNPIQSKNPI